MCIVLHCILDLDPFLSPEKTLLHMDAVSRIRIRRDLALLDLDPDPVETKLTKKNE
jgi:hypothetical protein